MNEKVYETNGMKMHYWVGGKKDGKVILWLHAGGVGAMTYKEILDLLVEKYWVIAVDIPGFGSSSLPDMMWNFGDYAWFIKGWFDSLGVKEVSVVGHSFGGGIGVNLAMISKLVSKLILIDSAGMRPDFGELRLYWGLLFKTVNQFKDWHSMQVIWRITVDFVVNFGKRVREIRQLRKIVLNSVYRDYQLDRIRIPTLILWGQDDVLLPLAHGEKMAKNIKGSKLMVLNGGHD